MATQHSRIKLASDIYQLRVDRKMPIGMSLARETDRFTLVMQGALTDFLFSERGGVLRGGPSHFAAHFVLEYLLGKVMLVGTISQSHARGKFFFYSFLYF